MATETIGEGIQESLQQLVDAQQKQYELLVKIEEHLAFIRILLLTLGK